jgi:hypothetical protein
MGTNFYATKDRPGRVRAGCRHMSGEEYRREMRAALHDLPQRLGQRHNDPSGVRVAVTADPAPSREGRIKKSMFQKLQGFYTIFTFCALP